MPDLGEEVILARGPSRTVIVCWQVFVFLQASEATGSSKLQESVADTVRPGAQVNEGAVVSRIVIVWVQLALVPQPSVAVQVRAITSEAPQPVVTASAYVTATWPHASCAEATPVAFVLVSAGHSR